MEEKFTLIWSFRNRFDVLKNNKRAKVNNTSEFSKISDDLP